MKLQVFGNLETKYKVKEYGLTFTEKWNTDNVVAMDVTIQDQLAQGLKFTLDTSFAPQTGLLFIPIFNCFYLTKNLL